MKDSLKLGLLGAGGLVVIGLALAADPDQPRPESVQTSVPIVASPTPYVLTPESAIPTVSAVPSATDTATATVALPSPAPVCDPLIYTVHSGDTLYDIGVWFSFHGYSEVFQQNAQVIGQNPDLIRPGQQFVIPGACKQ